MLTDLEAQLLNALEFARPFVVTAASMNYNHLEREIAQRALAKVHNAIIAAKAVKETSAP